MCILMYNGMVLQNYCTIYVPTLVCGIVSSIGIKNLSANVLRLTSVKLVSNQAWLDYYTFSATAETSVCNTHSHYFDC